MKYRYQEGIEKRKSRKWLLLPVVGIFMALYTAADILSPEILYVLQPTDTTAKKLVSERPNPEQNRVYVPKINVDVAVVPISGDESAALNHGAIERAPTSGNPKEGGNYVVAAHRFSLGVTPYDTQVKSPLYHLSKLRAGDDIYVDYKGERYAYKVEEQKIVSATETDIELRTDDSRLTLYSYDLSGSKTTREAVTAKAVGKIVWTSGQPRLQTY